MYHVMYNVLLLYLPKFYSFIYLVIVLGGTGEIGRKRQCIGSAASRDIIYKKPKLVVYYLGVGMGWSQALSETASQRCHE